MRRALLLLLFVAAAARAEDRPTLVLVPPHVVGATLPLSIVRTNVVKRRLGSGLTTTILIAARDLDANAAGGARIEIRFDLWDEVYLVRRVDFDRHVDDSRVTANELERWWRGAVVRLMTTSRDRVRLQLDVSVLPFSAAEERDARQWLSKSGGVGGARGEGTAVVDALIGTTLSAKPLVTWRWNGELSMK